MNTVPHDGRAPLAAGDGRARARGEGGAVGGGSSGAGSVRGGGGGGGSDAPDVSFRVSGRDGARRMSALALSCLHALALADPILGPREDPNLGPRKGPATAHPLGDTSAGRRSGGLGLVRGAGAAAMAAELLRPEMAALLPDGADGGGRPSRLLATLGEGRVALTLRGAGMVLVFGCGAPGPVGGVVGIGRRDRDMEQTPAHRSGGRPSTPHPRANSHPAVPSMFPPVFSIWITGEPSVALPCPSVHPGPAFLFPPPHDRPRT